MKNTLKGILFCFLIFFSAYSQAVIQSYVGDPLDPNRPEHDYSGVQAYIDNDNDFNYGLPHIQEQGAPTPYPETTFYVGDTITIGFELDVATIEASDFYFNDDANACYRPETADDHLGIDPNSVGSAIDLGFFDDCSSYGTVQNYDSTLLDWQYYLVSDNSNIAAISGFTSIHYNFAAFEAEQAKNTLTFKITSGIDDQFNSVGHWDAYIVIENTVFKLENGFDVIPEPGSIYLLGMGFLLLRYRVRK